MSTQAASEHPADGHDDHGHHGPKWLQHHFDTPAQQFEASKIGMWAFLVQELLFFSGLFVAYGVYRSWYPETFVQCSHQLDKVMGGCNTVVLLFSSLTAAMAVRSSQLGERSATSRYLIITILCACGFLVIKYFEYTHKFHAGLLPGHYFHPHADHIKGGTSLPASGASFFAIYFMMTGVHGVHVIVGIGVLIWILMRNMRGDFSREYFTPVDVTALYWHLVDLVWIYLFPLLYLIH